VDCAPLSLRSPQYLPDLQWLRRSGHYDSGLLCTKLVLSGESWQLDRRGGLYSGAEQRLALRVGRPHWCTMVAMVLIKMEASRTGLASRPWLRFGNPDFCQIMPEVYGTQRLQVEIDRWLFHIKQYPSADISKIDYGLPEENYRFTQKGDPQL